MINANAPVVVVELGRNPITSATTNLEVAVSKIGMVAASVVQVANLAALPALGSSSILYVTLDTNQLYSWVVDTYTPTGASLGEDDNYVTDTEKSNLHAPSSDNQDLSNLVEKVTGYSLVPDTEIAKIHSAGTDIQDLSGKADLVDGFVPASQLPSYVDDILEYANLAAFPVTGESAKIYLTLDTNLTYRWSGTVYVEISASLALGETSSTAYRGDRGKTAYDHSQVAHAPSDAQANPSAPTQEQAEDVADVSGTLYSWGVQRLVQLVTAWWASITIDGDKLPAVSATKKGGVPATGSPTGLFLKDDGTWAAGGAVSSVNTKAGVVVLTAADVGAEPAITAGTTAQYLKGDKSLGTLNQAAVAGLTTADSPTFTGLSLGSSVGDGKLLLFESASAKYGFGIRANEVRWFLPTGGNGHLSVGGLTVATDLNSFVEWARFQGGNFGVGVIPTAARVQIKGTGTTTGVALQVQDSADAVKFTVLDSGNMALAGVTPASWHSNYGAIEFPHGSIFYDKVGIDKSMVFMTNAYYDGIWKYKTASHASQFLTALGELYFRVAPSGSANAAITWLEAIRVLNTGAVIFAKSINVTPTTAAVTSTTSAIPITSTNCEVSITGAAVATLANGTTVGQIINIYVKAVSNAGDSLVITPTTLLGGATITFAANPLGKGISLIWTASGWAMNTGATIA